MTTALVKRNTALEKRDSLAAALESLWGQLESGESQRGYRADWGRYCSWCMLEEIDPATATVADIQRYLNHMRDRKMAKATRARALSVLREVYRALVVGGVCLANPAREVKNPKVDNTPRTPWMDEEKLKKFFDFGEGDWYGRRNHLVISCLFLLGWRRAEIARIEMEDITNHTIKHVVKRGKQKIVGLPNSLENEVIEWLGFSAIKTGPLFPRSPERPEAISGKIVYDIVKARAREVGIPKIAPHAIRRSFVTILERRGEDIRNIQMAVSHESVTTTERYQKASKAARQAPGERLADLVYGKKSK